MPCPSNPWFYRHNNI